MILSNDDVQIANLFKEISVIRPEQTREWSDIGIAKIFCELFFHEEKFNDTLQSWVFFDGTRWILDRGSKHLSECVELFYMTLKQYAISLNRDNEDSFLKNVLKYGSRNKREILVRDAKERMTVFQDDFDKKTHLFNCLNGTLDLDTFEFREHRAEDMLTQLCGCDYDPTADSTEWMKFLYDVTVGDEELVNYILRCCGYWLTADTSLEVAYFNYGPTTRNGKSVFTETFTAMMGSYATGIPPKALAMTKYDNSASMPFLAELAGARWVITSEPPKGMQLNEALFKRMTGGDRLTVKRIYERPFSFVPHFKICINCNSRPAVADDTVFISDRMRVIPFDRHFNPDEQDRCLKQKFRNPKFLSSVLNCSISGLKDFRENGERVPLRVKNANDDYKLMSDKIQRFFDDCMVADSGYTRGGEVYLEYSKWCVDHSFYVEGKKEFFNALRERGLLINATIDHNTVKNLVHYSICK